MKRVLIAAIAAFILSSCGDGGRGEGGNQNIGLDPSISPSCGFNLSTFLNGTNALQASSYWSCVENNMPGQIQIFSDGTGFRNVNGLTTAFTWSQTGCRSLNYRNNNVDGSVTELNGSISSGALTGRDNFNGQSFNASCVLRNISAPSTSNPAPANGSNIPNFSGNYRLAALNSECQGLFDSRVRVDQNGANIQVVPFNNGFNQAAGLVDNLGRFVVGGNGFLCGGMINNGTVIGDCVLQTRNCSLRYQHE